MSTGRLAYNPGPIDAYGALRSMVGAQMDDASEIGPVVRPAHGSRAQENRVLESPPGANDSPAVRLALKHGARGTIALTDGSPPVRLACAHGQAERNGTLDNPLLLPALLVSYVYLKPFLKNRHRYHIRDWVLDSGAYSAFKSGAKIDLMEFNEVAAQLMAEHPDLKEVYALDVIGDWRGSLRNYEATAKAGYPWIPTYHAGEPEEALRSLAAGYPKIAISASSGIVGPAKGRFFQQVFARVWPKKIHGFGIGQEKLIMALPWHSVDATNWELGPCKFGSWRTYGKMSVRGSRQDLRSEVEWYLKLEAKARQRWRKEMAQLEALEPSPSVRLALSGSGKKDEMRELSLGDAPSVRLVANGHAGRDEMKIKAPGPK